MVYPGVVLFGPPACRSEECDGSRCAHAAGGGVFHARSTKLDLVWPMSEAL